MEGRNSGNFLNVRYWFCCVLFRALVITGFCLVLYKAFRLQVVEHGTWEERARAQVETTFEVPAYRGSIYDRNGRLLSYSVPQFSLYADSRLVENPKVLASKLGRILRMSEEILAKRLSSGRHFVWIKRHLTDQQALTVGNLKVRGLNFVPEYKRFYPHRNVGGQVLGFVGTDGSGQEGIEKAYDKVLRQDTMTVGQLRDGVRKTLWLQPSPPPEPSESLGLRLSLDAFVQYVSEFELEKGATQYNARAGEVVVLDARTSEVLAMANWPLFDPNLPDKKNPDSWRNRAVTDYYEPGSTFKVFLMCAALEEGAIKERDRIFCENGKVKLAGHMINDVHPYGWLTVSEVIKHSSNIAASKIALQLGCERYYRYIRKFGFGELSGVNLPGEVKGCVRNWKMWRPIDLCTTGFGQSIGVTSLQLAKAIGVIASEGEYAQPIMVKEVVNADGQMVRQMQSEPPRRVIQKKTANLVSSMMRSVTEEGGTGVNAAPPGYTAAGKTGTAQVLDPATKRYASNKYTSLFTGFVPAEHPRLIITVAIHEPHGAIYGGVVAAPIFRNIAAKVLPYLGVAPSYDATKPPAPVKIVNAAAGSTGNPGKASQPSKEKSRPAANATKACSPVEIRKPPADRPISNKVQTAIPGSAKPAAEVPQASAPVKQKKTVGLALIESRPTENF